MATKKANQILCRIHEGMDERVLMGACDDGDNCFVVGAFLNLGTRLAAIQALAKQLCEALVNDGEVIPGMDWLDAAETLRVMSESLITGTFSEDQRKRLERKKYWNQGLWLLDHAGLIGEQERGPRLTAEWPPLPTYAELHPDPPTDKPPAPPNGKALTLAPPA